MERLLEREHELGMLAQLVEDAADGRGGVLLIAGEAGIGKTSLVRSIRQSARGRVSFLMGSCEPLSVPAPLGPIRELAVAAGRRDLVDSGGDDRLGLTRSLLDALIARSPALVVIEDAHWADPASLDVARLLARWVEEAALGLVITYRDDELSASPALGILVGDLVGGPLVTRLTVAPLSDEAVRTLAQAAGADAREVARVTGGNPFLVVESLASEGGLPASVRDATLARVLRLSASGRGVVDVAAVIGQRFSWRLLGAVAPDDGEAVEEALALGVLTDDGQTLGFRHELIRQAVEASISGPRAAKLHALVVRALADDPDWYSSARLAHHAELAGLTSQAAQYARDAATEAERIGALREASLQLARVIRLERDEDPRERFELLLRYARAANFASRMHEALDGATEALALARREGDRNRQGRALSVLAWALWSLDRVQEARQAAVDAVNLLEDAGDPGDLARALAAHIRMEATAFDSVAAIEAGPRALELASRAGLEEMRVDVMISLGLARGHLGDPAAQHSLAQELDAARAAGLPFQTIRAFVNGIAVAGEARDHAALDELASQALPLFEQSQTAIPHDYATVLIARSQLDRGRWDDALDSAQRSRRSQHGGGPIALVVEGVVLARRGDPLGQEKLEQALSDVADVPPGWRHGLIRSGLAEAAWLAGDRRAGIAHALAGGAGPFADQFARSAGELALWAARCGQPGPAPSRASEPVRLELAGDWRGAVRAWRALDAPYEAALAAIQGDDRAARDAVAALHRLGARSALRAFTRERGARAGRGLRGPRRTTLANAAGLTRREQEVLAKVAQGLTNAGIADALSLSERTVAHHVSAILGKLGVSTRTAAVEAARAAGLLGQDGPVSRAT